jgi:hypothetical protein
MAARSCRVTITDRESIAHTVEVTASSLFEAAAMGLKAIRGNRWVAGIPDGFAPVKVRVTDIPVEHEVKLKDFTQWLERRADSPRDVIDRQKIREILGLSKSVGCEWDYPEEKADPFAAPAYDGQAQDNNG